MKYDAGKPRPGLLPPAALREISRVLAVGAVKYDDDNWRKVPGWRWRYLDALWRHVLDYMDVMESDADKETSLHVLAHAGCCLLFLLEQELRGAEGGDVPAERDPGA